MRLARNVIEVRKIVEARAGSLLLLSSAANWFRVEATGPLDETFQILPGDSVYMHPEAFWEPHGETWLVYAQDVAAVHRAGQLHPPRADQVCIELDAAYSVPGVVIPEHLNCQVRYGTVCASYDSDLLPGARVLIDAKTRGLVMSVAGRYHLLCSVGDVIGVVE